MCSSELHTGVDHMSCVTDCMKTHHLDEFGNLTPNDPHHDDHTPMPSMPGSPASVAEHGVSQDPHALAVDDSEKVNERKPTLVMVFWESQGN